MTTPVVSTPYTPTKEAKAMRAYLAAALAACAAAITSCSGLPSLQEREFNGNFIDAQPIEKNAVINAVLDPSDVDLYRIMSGPEAERVLLDITIHAVGDVALTVLRTNEEELLVVNDTSKRTADEYIRNLSIDDGNCFLRVARTDGAGTIPYRLTIFRHTAPENAERELNDSFEDATPLIPMTNTTGYFAPGRTIPRSRIMKSDAGIDVYRFGNPTDIMGNFSLSLTGVNGVDSMLIVFDGTTNIIASVDSAGEGKGEEIRGFLFPQESTFYAAVVSHNRKASAKPYQLSFTTGRYDEQGENEPNNTTEHAREIYAGLPVSGYHDYTGDIDIYRLLIAEDTANVRLSLSGVRGADTRIAVSDAREKHLFEVNESGIGRGEERPNAVVARGIYYLAVSATNDFHSYRKGYTLLAETVGRSGIEREPNDSAKTASRIIVPGSIRGFISAREDRDSFFFEVRSKTSFTIAAVPPSDLDLVLMLSGPTNGTIDANGRGGKESMTGEFTDGTYMLEVRSKAGYNTRMPYRLSISENERTQERRKK
ncbi:MAG: hypothetical protein AABZ39_09690 [Spirochaetota bacterium]